MAYNMRYKDITKKTLMIIKIVFDYILFVLILLLILDSLGVISSPIDLMILSIVASIVGVIGYFPELWSNLKYGNYFP